MKYLVYGEGNKIRFWYIKSKKIFKEMINWEVFEKKKIEWGIETQRKN